MSRKQDKKKRRQRALEDVRLKEHPEHTTRFYYDEQLVRGARVTRFMFVRYMSAFIFFPSVSTFMLGYWFTTSGQTFSISGYRSFSM